ncbi:MAG: hypothetical protein JXR10_11270 [Cyclobacteriaceae bacterium]
MKTTGMTMLLLLSVLIVGAQTPKGLKGPAAKNHKVWKQDIKVSKAQQLVVIPQEKLKGPVAKNKKAWNKSGHVNVIAVEVGKSTPKLKGPAAKNQKAWEGKTSSLAQDAKNKDEMSVVTN